MRITTNFVLLTACLFVLPAQAGIHEFDARNHTPREIQVKYTKYREMVAKRHLNYQQQRLLQFQQLRKKVRQAGLDGFAGAGPEDTAWALSVIHDRQAMQLIHNSFQSGWQKLAEQAKSEGQITTENIAAPFIDDRARFRASPNSTSSSPRLVFTAQGAKIAATTPLNAAGMEIQSQFGCTGCHRK